MKGIYISLFPEEEVVSNEVWGLFAVVNDRFHFDVKHDRKHLINFWTVDSSRK